MTESNEQWQVVTNDHVHRVLYSGDEESASLFVEQHFPHVHVEPGVVYGDEGPSADVLLRDPSGNEMQYVGGEWVEEERKEAAKKTQQAKKET